MLTIARLNLPACNDVAGRADRVDEGGARLLGGDSIQVRRLHVRPRYEAIASLVSDVVLLVVLAASLYVLVVSGVAAGTGGALLGILP